jgi:hypothetical protein
MRPTGHGAQTPLKCAASVEALRIGSNHIEHRPVGADDLSKGQTKLFSHVYGKNKSFRNGFADAIHRIDPIAAARCAALLDSLPVMAEDPACDSLG